MKIIYRLLFSFFTWLMVANSQAVIPVLKSREFSKLVTKETSYVNAEEKQEINQANKILLAALRQEPSPEELPVVLNNIASSVLDSWDEKQLPAAFLEHIKENNVGNALKKVLEKMVEICFKEVKIEIGYFSISKRSALLSKISEQVQSVWPDFFYHLAWKLMDEIETINIDQEFEPDINTLTVNGGEIPSKKEFPGLYEMNQKDLMHKTRTYLVHNLVELLRESPKTGFTNEQRDFLNLRIKNAISKENSKKKREKKYFINELSFLLKYSVTPQDVDFVKCYLGSD